MNVAAFFLMTPPPLAIFGDIGGSEVLVVLGAILVLFGGKGVPEIARKLGKMTSDLQRASAEFKKQLLTADQELNTEITPLITEYESLTSEAPQMKAIDPALNEEMANPYDTVPATDAGAAQVDQNREGTPPSESATDILPPASYSPPSTSDLWPTVTARAEPQLPQESTPRDRAD